jgi:hypothetical protein
VRSGTSFNAQKKIAVMTENLVGLAVAKDGEDIKEWLLAVAILSFRPEPCA